MEMLLHLDKIPSVYNVVAAVSTWIILAAFLVIPGTFTSIKNSKAYKDANSGDAVAHAILHSVANIGLVWASGILALVGAFGCTFLWFRWRYNYVWLNHRVFMPVTLNSTAGLLTTIVNVYTAQHGVWSITAKITAIVAGSSMVVAGFLFVSYYVMLDKLKAKHQRELDAAYRSGLERLYSRSGRDRASGEREKKTKARHPKHDPMIVV